MAKFKMKFELTGLKLEIEGERADIPLMAANIGQQFAGLLEPAANIANETTSGDSGKNAAIAVQPVHEPLTPRRPARRVARSTTATMPSTVLLEIQHDETTYGWPLQKWNPTLKSIWTLHVVESLTGTKELSPSEIAKVFNHYFKQFGKLQPSNISRDLAKSKSGATALFVLDSESNPPKWSLSAAGKKEALRLVDIALAGPSGERVDN